MRTRSEVQTFSQSTFSGSINVEKLFELAIETANQGYKLKAMEIAREALIFAKQTNDYTMVYIHSFLAVLNTDFNKISSARIHIYNAMNRLNTKHYSYETDNQYLTVLLSKLNKLESPVSKVSEPIAA